MASSSMVAIPGEVICFVVSHLLEEEILPYELLTSLYFQPR
ncbi:hypothetical protein BrE312_3900 [Brenneria sp. EniD312]|nr:hypothetical protein BrE312_3900 [Brenneria sp. EniD312]